MGKLRKKKKQRKPVKVIRDGSPDRERDTFAHLAPTYARCWHAEPKLVLTQPIQVYAGSKMDGAQPPEGAVILDLSGSYHPLFEIHGIAMRRLQTRMRKQPRIILDWPDMKASRMSVEDWTALAEDLKGLKSALFVACLGGHGRTGTTLAILADLWGAVPIEDDPVQFVRKAYCEEAVETQAQYEYVARVTGRTLVYRPKSSPIVPTPLGGAYPFVTDQDGEKYPLPEKPLLPGASTPAEQCMERYVNWDGFCDSLGHLCRRDKAHGRISELKIHECRACFLVWKEERDGYGTVTKPVRRGKVRLDTGSGSSPHYRSPSYTDPGTECWGVGRDRSYSPAPAPHVAS
jgi:hypothetical protein